MKQKRLKFSARTIMIVVAMLFTSMGVSAQDDTYIVVGSNTEIFGTTWAWVVDENNMMMLGDDGKYRKVYTVDKAYDNVQLKVVRNENEWIGIGGGENYYRYNFEFNLTDAGTFTVVFDPSTYEISVTGNIVETITELSIEQVFAAGNGGDNWLNGVWWNPAAVKNEMTKIDDNVWEITFKDVPEDVGREVKFAINGTWAQNFGYPNGNGNGNGNIEPGEWYDAAYDGGSIMFDTDDVCTVTITLDLSNFEFSTKTGARFKIDILYGEAEEVELAPNGYGTYYNGGNMVTLPTGVVAYTVSGISEGLPTYVKIADGDDNTNRTVKAATAMLLYCKKRQEVILTLTESNDTYSGSNLLKGSDSETTTTGGEKYYKLTYSNNNDNFGWYWGNAEGAAFVSPAHKAWLALPAAAGARAFIGLPGGEETGIITVQSQLVNDGAWYDLNGRRLSMKPIIKGVYVNNGNKVVIR